MKLSKVIGLLALLLLKIYAEGRFENLGMKRYVFKRVLELVPTVLIIIIANWMLIHLAPIDPALALAGETAPPETIETLRIAYGLDKPIHEQLIIYLTKVFQGDLGVSYLYHGVPVVDLVFQKIPPTLLLILPAHLISFAIALPLGAYSGSQFPSKKDTAISFLTLISYSLPVFWLSMLLVMIFSLHFGLFPVAGMTALTVKKTGLAYFLDVLWHLTLPVLSLIAYFLPMYYRVTRASIIEITQEDFVKTARCLGLSERSIRYRHMLRNALLPTITLIGLRLGLALTGSVIVESVFAWPGLGGLLFRAILSRDYPLASGIFMISAILVVVASILTDITYAYLDPRVRFG